MNVRKLAHHIQLHLKPGDSIEVTPDIFSDISAPYPFNGADWILENIVGSAYSYSYRIDPVSRNIVFSRRLNPLTDNRRTYVSADRRHLFELSPDGTYKYKG